MSRDHLDEAGESYWQHLRFALLVGALLVGAGISCLIHAFAPGLCRRSGSGVVKLVSELMIDRQKLGPASRAASGVLTLFGLLLLCAVPLALVLAAPTHVLSIPLALLVLGLPAAYLWSNPDLDPVA
jgi:uncharacterized membrane protein HdeD (DUF308 family)